MLVEYKNDTMFMTTHYALLRRSRKIFKGAPNRTLKIKWAIEMNKGQGLIPRMYHNLIRRMSFYILTAVTRYLIRALDVAIPPGQYFYCTRTMAILHMSGLCSTMFIISMTFERFYSIIRPHKAASFNTLKKAKIITVIAVVFSIVINIPHLYTTTNNGKSCVPFGRSMQTLRGQMYYGFSALLNFIIPLMLLLSMKCYNPHFTYEVNVRSGKVRK